MKKISVSALIITIAIVAMGDVHAISRSTPKAERVTKGRSISVLSPTVVGTPQALLTCNSGLVTSACLARGCWYHYSADGGACKNKPE